MTGRLPLEARLARLRVQLETLNATVRVDNTRLRHENAMLRACVRALLRVVRNRTNGPDVEVHNTD